MSHNRDELVDYVLGLRIWDDHLGGAGGGRP